ncbi:MAG TPA: FumA C-terminus/TtdB family hydratase beta subunit [Candidatus Aquicultor sp.]|jgi:fumarate hydratase subunit beta
MAKQITTPLTDDVVRGLNAGDQVEITGTIYTARDQAHAYLAEAIERGSRVPFDLTGQIIFYAGPSEVPPGKVSGAIGPTTSARMDPFTPTLLARGLKGMIGKGPRSDDVKAALHEFSAVYFAAPGGAAALLTSYIKKSEVFAYPELGPEAVYKLEVEKLPVIVAMDAHGRDLYKEGREAYKEL